MMFCGLLMMPQQASEAVQAVSVDDAGNHGHHPSSQAPTAAQVMTPKAMDARSTMARRR